MLNLETLYNEISIICDYSMFRYSVQRMNDNGFNWGSASSKYIDEPKIRVALAKKMVELGLLNKNWNELTQSGTKLANRFSS